MLVAIRGKMKLSKDTKKKVDELLLICKSKQGEYLPSNHGSGSWATTYSNEFINASCDLYLIFKNLGSCDPIYDLSKLFRESGIRSCRNTEFVWERVEYLYSSHLHFRLKQKEELGKPKDKKKDLGKLKDKRKACCYCNKKLIDVVQHVSQAHAEKWEAFSDKNNIDLKGKTRCMSCGVFLKSMLDHNKKCPKTLEKSN
jgi:hypothetical protein